jgi:hypothetical protein
VTVENALDTVLQDFLNDIHQKALERVNEWEWKQMPGLYGRIKDEFVEAVVDWPEGCENAKADFLIACGLERWLPTLTVTFEGSVYFKYGQGGGDSDNSSDDVREALESAMRDLNPSDYDLSIDCY